MRDCSRTLLGWNPEVKKIFEIRFYVAFINVFCNFFLFQVCEELGVEEQVFPLAVNYLDRFLCNCCINKRHLQLAASVCIMMASKIRQCQYVSIETLCFYADHSITPQAMKVRNWLFLSFLLFLLIGEIASRRVRPWCHSFVSRGRKK